MPTNFDIPFTLLIIVFSSLQSLRDNRLHRPIPSVELPQRAFSISVGYCIDLWRGDRRQQWHERADKDIG